MATDIFPDKALMSASYRLLDQIPFPVLKINDQYGVEWMNQCAKDTYHQHQGHCYEISHNQPQPCDHYGENCPKFWAESTQETVSTLHVHDTTEGKERFKVVAIPLQEGGILEWHIPIGDIGAEDSVTGLLTRNETTLAATRTLALMQRMQKAFAVLMLDIDHFKVVNDKYGHNTGDVVLSRVGQLLRQELRSSDAFGRWGGE